METKLTGEFRNLEVERDTRLNGRVQGLRVVRGAGLTMNGMLDGNVRIEADGLLILHGLLATDDVSNDGMLMVAGMVGVGSEHFDRLGSFAVQPGSMVGREVLERDGSLRSAQGHEDVTVGPDDGWCVWRSGEGFVPMDVIRQRTANLEAAEVDTAD